MPQRSGGLLKAWREECAVFGVWDHVDASRLAYLGLYAMQHRGQESAGIVSLHEGQHYQHKGLGLVGDVFTENELAKLRGRTAIGHVRYSTTGANFLINAQPMTANLLGGPVAVAHNGNLVNASKLRKKLQQEGAIFQGSNDTECILHLLSHTKTDQFVPALAEVLPQLEGAFSCVFLNRDCLVAARDAHGFRPLVLGVLKTEHDNAERPKYVVASETCAFDLLGAEYVREVLPGEMIWIDNKGLHSMQWAVAKPKLAKCIFEHIYFSRPDSIVFGKSVYESRKRFGEWLAKENPLKADVVVPVPDSGIAAALGYSKQSGLPFEFGIIRNHYVGRTFIQPHQSVRNFGVKIKLNPQTAVLSGKSVVVVDDSLVRGTTSQKIIRLMRQAGAREVHMRIASPPTTGPCYYGVDTPQKSQLIASHQNVEQIRQYIGADSLAYLSMEGMFSAMQEPSQNSGFCAACFDGNYPTPLHLEDEVSA